MAAQYRRIGWAYYIYVGNLPLDQNMGGFYLAAA